MHKVHIIQPAVPLYRKALFEGIKKSLCLEVKIYTASKDFLNVSSVTALDVDFYSAQYSFKTYLSGRFSLFWQSNLKIDYQVGDKLVVNGNPRILSNLKQVFLAKLNGVEVIWWGHGWSSTSTKFGAKIRMILTRILSDKVLLYTEKEVENYISKGFSREKMFALNNGLDTSEINQAKSIISESDVLEFRNELGFTGYKVAIFVGRLTEKTLVEQLVEVVPLLHKNIKIVIVGDGESRILLQETAKSLNVTDQVVFAGAIFEENELAKWMLAADFFVYPGAVGLSLLHAFSYGLPAVIHSNNFKHMPEHAAFIDGVNGISFQENDIESLAKKMNEMALKVEDKKWSEGALETVIKSYNMEDMVQRFVDTVKS